MRRTPLVLLALCIFATTALADGRNQAPAGAEDRPFPDGPTPAPRVVPATIAFQGYLTDGGGAPLVGTVNLDLALYDAASGGTVLWSETQTSIGVSGGVFSIALGGVTPLPTALFDGTSLFLGIRVDGSAELAPRTELRTSPFAFRSLDSDNLGGVGPDGYVSVTGDDLSGPLGLYAGVEALETGGAPERVTSTTDVRVRRFYLDGTQADGWVGDAAIVLSFNGVADTPSGGSGVVTVYRNAVIIATINVPGGGGRPWTYRVSAPALANDDVLDVLVRSNLSTQPMFIRHISLDLVGAAAAGGNTLDQAYDEGGFGAGRTINTTAGPVEIVGSGGLDVEGRIEAGIENTTSGEINVYNAGRTGPVAEITTDAAGGAIYVRDGNGTRKTYIETDGSTGGGGWFGVYGDAAFQGYFVVDGNSGGTGDPVIAMRGDGGIATIDTRGTGDDFVQLPDGAINADEIVDEAGIAQGRDSGNTAITESTMEDIVATTITTPGPGYIFLTASAQFRISGTTGSDYIGYQIDETAGGGQDTNYYYFTGWTASSEDGTHYLPGCAQRTYFKASAGTYTFRLEARNASGTGAKYAWNPVITAVFVPTSYGTVTTAANPSEVSQFGEVERSAGGSNGDGVTAAPAALVDLRELELRVAREEARLAEARRRLLEAERAQNGPEVVR